jgi:hypothetical protein
VTGLEDAKEALKLHFGDRQRTAKQLLDNVLAGEELVEEEHGLVRTFIMKLECVYWQAVDTGRESSFHSLDLYTVYKDIIQKKLLHLAPEYVKRQVEAEAWFFLQFIDFLTQQNRTSEIGVVMARRAGLMP